MAEKPDWSQHVYRTDEPRYMGFFFDAEAANKWVKVQKEGTYEVTDRKPVKTAEEAGNE